MGNRFGRRQKRHMRAEIEERQAVNMTLNAVLTQERNKAVSLEARLYALDEIIRRWDDEIRYLLGPYTSFAINDTTFRVNHIDQIRQMPVMPRERIGIFPGLIPDQFSYYVETILHLVSQLHTEENIQLRRYLRFQIKIGSSSTDEVSHYGFSERLWHDLKLASSREQQRFAMRIGEEAAALMMKPPKKPKVPA